VTTYVDSSALLKRYVAEEDSALADAWLGADTVRVTARHTVVEVRRSLARVLAGEDLAAARAAFTADLGLLSIVELDATTCQVAASIAETMGVPTLDAMHLAAAQRVAEPGLRFLTFDIRQAEAARALGLEVVPA
jgi:uncharacterized protein